MPESNKEKRENLEGPKGEMPIDNRASAEDGSAMPMMAGGSFMSKHSQSRMPSGKPMAMQLMGEDGKPKSSMERSSAYMLNQPPMEKGYGHSKSDGKAKK